ncbi:MAG: glycosyltransferase family 2 protein [Candidatus Omnitrophota bacterium]
MPYPRFSVIIPVYNGEMLIAKAIESVLSQTYPAYEIIVVDDGSKDSTPEILEKYRDSIIRMRINNSRGSARPRNMGLSIAKGDFISFLDADDVWFKNKLMREKHFIDKYPEIGFFCSNYAVRLPFKQFRLKKHFDVINFPKKVNFNIPLKKDAFSLLIRENFVGGPSATTVKKEVVDRVGFFTGGNNYAEDYDYWLRCARYTNFVLISEVLVYKKIHSTNLSNNTIRFYVRHENVLKDILVKQKEYLEEKKLIPEWKKAMAENHYCLGNRFFEDGRKKDAFRNYLEGLKICKTPSNLLLFLWIVLKKLVRVVSFGVIHRKKIIEVREYENKSSASY